MRASLILLGVFVALSVGCASAFPAGVFDAGRGAKQLPRGTTRLQLGGGGGAAPFTLAAGGGAGARIEHQLLDDLALGADMGAGLQTLTYVPSLAPVGAYLGAQYNPAGLDWLALRLRVGGGVDIPLSALIALPYGAKGAEVARSQLEPYVAALLQVVLSTELADHLTAYVAPGIGVKQFLLASTGASLGANTSVTGDTARVYCSLLSECGDVNTLLFPGVTTGLSAAVMENMSVYASGTLTPTLLFGQSHAAPAELSVLLSPSANLQAGIAFTF